jgi:hypothetical protein
LFKEVVSKPDELGETQLTLIVRQSGRAEFLNSSEEGVVLVVVNAGKNYKVKH